MGRIVLSWSMKKIVSMIMRIVENKFDFLLLLRVIED